MCSLTKITASAALAALALAAAPASAAILPLPYSYSFTVDPNNGGYTQHLTLNNGYNFDLTGVTLTETRLDVPSITDSTLIGTLAAGKSITSDADFLFPASFGNQPENTQFDPQGLPAPFTLSVTGQGSNGQSYGFSFKQTYNPDASPAAIAAVPETGTIGLLAAGLGLFGFAGLRRGRLG